MQTEHKHYFARIPIIALLILLGLAPWLAVLLFILRATDKDADIWTAFTETCTGPYMNDVMQAEAGNAPDASSYVDAAMEAMKTAGGLE